MVLILLFGLSKKGIVKTECSKILNIFGTRIVESMKVIASDKKIQAQIQGEGILVIYND